MPDVLLVLYNVKLKNKDILFYEKTHDLLKPFKSFIDNNGPAVIS